MLQDLERVQEPAPNRCGWCGAPPHPTDRLAGCDCYDRATCLKTGAIGHLGCGWCKTHDQPAFALLCNSRDGGCEIITGDSAKAAWAHRFRTPEYKGHEHVEIGGEA